MRIAKIGEERLDVLVVWQRPIITQRMLSPRLRLRVREAFELTAERNGAHYHESLSLRPGRLTVGQPNPL